jgi:hypothetical protein
VPVVGLAFTSAGLVSFPTKLCGPIHIRWRAHQMPRKLHGSSQLDRFAPHVTDTHNLQVMIWFLQIIKKYTTFLLSVGYEVWCIARLRRMAMKIRLSSTYGHMVSWLYVDHGFGWCIYLIPKQQQKKRDSPEFVGLA